MLFISPAFLSRQMFLSARCLRLQMLDHRFQREEVAVRAETADYAEGNGGDIGMVPEFFARVNIGEMDFDDRHRDGGDCVSDSDASVRIRRRVDEDAVCPVDMLPDDGDDFAFVV